MNINFTCTLETTCYAFLNPSSRMHSLFLLKEISNAPNPKLEHCLFTLTSTSSSLVIQIQVNDKFHKFTTPVIKHSACNSESFLSPSLHVCNIFLSCHLSFKSPPVYLSFISILLFLHSLCPLQKPRYTRYMSNYGCEM